MESVIICILVVILAGCGVGGLYLNHQNKKLKKQMEEQETKNAAENKAKNEIKESMETGNSYNDFTNSVDIMHNLASKK